MELPEQKARENIDNLLKQAGWVVQEFKRVDPTASLGVAVTEYPTESGPADYILFVDGDPVGVIEAKKEGSILTTVHEQSYRYSTSNLKGFQNLGSLPFVYESTGTETFFCNYMDPTPRSREIFAFHRPETLQKLNSETDTLRKQLQHLPELEESNLRKCQFNAINNLEESLSNAKPKALIQMATGSGKTYTAITSIYRLLKYADIKRVLFLVDTRNLGEQAQQEFQRFTPADDKRKFTELYNVQLLKSNFIDSSSHVCISTIQRMYSILSKEEIDDSVEQTSLNEIQLSDKTPKFVNYNPDIPIEMFDLIIIDECHRSIYNLWKQVLDYFDSFLVGLTATPDSRTYAFFNENVVSEYTHEQAVADGVNVGFDVYTIETEISQKGGVILQDYVEKRSKLDRKKRWEQLDEDFEYINTQLDKTVVNKSQIRKIIQTFKDKIRTEIFPNRTEVPKTLIFAKSDSHADDIIRITREVFNETNDFCKKITYNVDKPNEELQNFRTAFNPRIVVTVDMIATGTDVKPIECLIFMRDVKSRNYFEQMKGRGTRTYDYDGMKSVTPSTPSNKTHFVIIDAVGVCKSVKTDSRPLERKKSVPLKDLMLGVALGQRDEDTLLSLANRLTRIEKQIGNDVREKVIELTDGITINDLVTNLLNGHDPDINDAVKPDEELESYTEEQLKSYNHELSKSEPVKKACTPFSNPDLRDYLEACRKELEQILDNQNIDKLIFAGFDEQAKEKAQENVKKFKDFLETNKDELTALKIFYSQPYKRRVLTFEMLKELSDNLQKAPFLLTNDVLWFSYDQLFSAKVHGNNTKRILTDIVSLLRFELGIDDELNPYSEIINRNFKEWIFKKNAGHVQFTEEQTEWLRMIKDHIISSASIDKDDFDNTPFAEHGGLMKVWNLFGKDLDNLIEEMNVELVA